MSATQDFDSDFRYHDSVLIVAPPRNLPALEIRQFLGEGETGQQKIAAMVEDQRKAALKSGKGSPAATNLQVTCRLLLDAQKRRENEETSIIAILGTELLDFVAATSFKMGWKGLYNQAIDCWTWRFKTPDRTLKEISATLHEQDNLAELQPLLDNFVSFGDRLEDRYKICKKITQWYRETGNSG